MGQEFFEDKPWSDDPKSANLIDWDGVRQGTSPWWTNLRCTPDVIRPRWRQPALRGPLIRVFHVHSQTRILAFHRWLDARGRDVIGIASLSDTTFPTVGRWLEVLNTDVYDHCVTPNVVENMEAPLRPPESHSMASRRPVPSSFQGTPSSSSRKTGQLTRHQHVVSLMAL